MTLGIRFFAAFAWTAFKGESHQTLHHFWGMVAYIANTLVFNFLYSVVLLLRKAILVGKKLFNEGTSWGFLFLLYVYVQLSRSVVVGVLYPLLCRFGHGLDWKESVILTWSGLRGAVSLSLALSVKQSSGNLYLSSETGTRFLFFTGGIVFLTLVVNGSTTQLLLHLLGMDTLTATKGRFRANIDSQGVVSAHLDEHWSEGLNVLLSAEVDIKNGERKFGCGIVIR